MHVADAMRSALVGLRKAIAKRGDLYPISEDMLIGISAPLEKNLRMVHAQETQLTLGKLTHRRGGR